MRFRHYDALRVFTIAAQHSSFSAAAETLNVTKGAVSYQIKQLEQELGFALFRRETRGIALTAQGSELLATALGTFETVEQKISTLRRDQTRSLTIGLTTYFASRWLSPRLTGFMAAHPDIRLRIQPMIDLLAHRSEGIDLTIRWGNGHWDDMVIERLFTCPAFPTGNAQMAERVAQSGLEQAFSHATLLRDRDDSNAWSDWYDIAGLGFEARADTLIIPDPNVRVQAVIDGQGIALNDSLVTDELATGRLHRLSGIELSEYGYFLAYEAGALANPDIAAFVAWLRAEV